MLDPIRQALTRQNLMGEKRKDLMRVLYFTEGDSPHDRRFLSALANTPLQVSVLRQRIAQPGIQQGVEELRWPEGVPDWSGWRGWEAGKEQLSALIDAVKPDVVHAGPIQGPAFLSALAGFHPLIAMSWGYDMQMDAHRSPWMRCATGYTLAHSDLLIADCQAVAHQAVEFGFPAGQIIQFPWGVDLHHFSKEKGKDTGLVWRRDLGWQDHFVVICNRSWSPKYGVDVLARAFVCAARQNAELRLLLVGSGPQAEELQEILDPVADRVFMPGWVDQSDLPAAYCAADLFISPSHCDGSSVSLLEALACGLPALVSDIPSNLEWVQPGLNGDIFSDGDAVMLEGKVLALASDKHLSDLGLAARQVAERSADWQKNFHKLLRAYDRAVAEFTP